MGLERRFEHRLLNQSSGPHPKARFGGQTHDIGRRDAGKLFELRRQIADELQCGRIKNAIGVGGPDQHDQLVMNAEVVADGLVGNHFRCGGRDERVTVGAQFQPENPRRDGQGDNDDQCQHLPGMTDGIIRQPTKQADEQHMQIARMIK